MYLASAHYKGTDGACQIAVRVVTAAGKVYDPAVMRWIADIAYLVAAACYLPVLCYQMLRQSKNRRGWRQRFGHVAHRPATPKRVWLHAVSLGEVNASRRIVEELTSACRDREIVVSTTTDTGFARAVELYGADRVFRFPLDFSWVVHRVLDRIDPGLIVLTELEVWYNLVHLAARRGVPIAVINGRLTTRSARRLGRLGPIARSMFTRLDWVGAQDQAIADRFVALGTPADRVAITGSLKWDTAEVTDDVPGAGALARALGINRDRPLWVCGSTGPGEETVILDAYAQLLESGADVALAIVPRKPERFDEVAREISRRSFECVRRTMHPDGAVRSQPLNGRDVVLGDTMGELRKFYTLSTVAFVGRSLVPMGGSDPMEVAALAKPIVAGPHLENFAVAADAFRSEDALTIASTAGDLARTIGRLTSDPAAAKRAGHTARAVVLRHQGATATTLESLARLLN